MVPASDDGRQGQNVYGRSMAPRCLDKSAAVADQRFRWQRRNATGFAHRPARALCKAVG
jgi:hypothetical protein